MEAGVLLVLLVRRGTARRALLSASRSLLHVSGGDVNTEQVERGEGGKGEKGLVRKGMLGCRVR